jgi:hypothetical protein
MRITDKFALALALVGLLWSSSQVEAEGRNRVGTSAASQLLIPVGARDMALGGSSAAASTGIEALHWNPAGLASSTSAATILAQTTSYLADMQLNYAAVGANLGSFGHLAVSMKALSAGDIAVTTTSAPDGTGGTFSPTFFVLGTTYANSLTDRIRMGATVHFVSESMGRTSASGVSFSAGAQYENLGSVQGLDLGISIKHIGTRMTYGGSGLLYSGQVNGLRRPSSFYRVEASSADLPSLFEIGLSYNMPMGDSALSLNTLFQHQNYNYDEYRVGAEYTYNDMVSLRAGFDLPASADDDTYIFGTSFGVGLNLGIAGRDVQLDYAYTAAEYFDALNTFAFKLDF